jgi:hypothetical protein
LTLLRHVMARRRARGDSRVLCVGVLLGRA